MTPRGTFHIMKIEYTSWKLNIHYENWNPSNFLLIHYNTFKLCKVEHSLYCIKYVYIRNDDQCSSIYCPYKAIQRTKTLGFSIKKNPDILQKYPFGMAVPSTMIQSYEITRDSCVRYMVLNMVHVLHWCSNFLRDATKLLVWGCKAFTSRLNFIVHRSAHY